ncbi:MAG: GDP-mannose 4,6-dehydratase, partial [Candidatus Pacebacteria bacterium]|nr:GDP-mannose 4,6-dehydratase [Candidatus Paceibacterota bacterium]
RDFTYVGDIVRGFIMGMNSDIVCDVFNLVKGRCYTLNELIDTLNKILGTDIKPEYKENPLKNYVYETLADTQKAKNILGFEAEVDLEEGIKRILR